MMIVDLRSDTVTLPTVEMLNAIRSTQLGDDCLGEDPTVNKLEDLAAEKMGKEDALLVTSGTQANLVSVMANTRRGDQIIVEEEAHIYYYEGRGICDLAGVLTKTLKGKFGVFNPEDLENAIRPKTLFFPTTTLACIENTHNRAGGTIIEPNQIEALHKVTEAHGLKLHMDGARIFNAAVALKIDVKEFTKHVDSMMFCLSKGLSAPIGSIVVGDRDFIERTRSARKILGGGLKQAGIITVAGIVAIEKMVDRLEEDHVNARILAEELSKIDGISIDLKTVQTNIVKFDVQGLGIDSDTFISKLSEKSVKSSKLGKTLARMVTHRGITKKDVEYSINAVKTIVEELQV